MAIETPQYGAQLQSTLAPPAQSGGGGFSLFGWHPSLPNLGGITAIKQLASGFIGLPEQVYQLGSDVVGGREGQALGDVGRFGAGLGYGVENAATTAAGGIGVPFTRFNLGDEVLAPALQGVNRTIAGALGGNTENAYRPSTAWQRPGGPIAGFVQDLATAASVAAPIAKAAGAGATGALEAEAAANDAAAAGTGTAEEAAAASARAAEAVRHAHVAENFAHPYKFAGRQLSGLLSSAREAVTPVAEESAPLGAETPAAAYERTQAPEKPPMDLHAVGETLRGLQDPSVAAASAARDELSALAKTPATAAREELTNLAETDKSKLNVPHTETNPRPGAAVEEGMQTLTSAEEGARAGVQESAVAEDVAKRIAMPPPAWAQRITDALPDSVNRVLGQFAGPLDKMRFDQVKRDYERYVEVAQRVARTDPAVQASATAAKTLMESIPELNRYDASHAVGEEIAARMDGTAMVDSFIKGGGNPDVLDALHSMARRGYTGITDEMKAALPPEAAQALEDHINSAVDAWQASYRDRLQTLLASSKGAQGLEGAVLGDDAPTMTPTQVKKYRQAMQELRRAQVYRERIPEQLAKKEAQAARQSLLGDKATAEATALREKVGVLERTAESLHDSVPLALRDENIGEAVGNILEGIAAGGVTYDVGRNIATLPPEGFVVGLAQQFDVPVEQFVAQGRDIVTNALRNPINPEGDPYGPGVYAGPDARFGATTHVGEDGRQYVRGEISMSSWGGKQLERWQATVLGEAYRQNSLFDIASGERVDLSGTPDVQNLMAHYAGDALDPQSNFSRFARQLDKTNAKIVGLDAQATDDALRMYSTWDYSLSRSNPNYDQGEFFKNAAISYAKGAPHNVSLLAQTVLGLTTKEGVERALATMDANTVNEALKWYYDSHDYIEQMWRGKTMTMLDGSQRDAAEVFYDLLAATSVMASPKQNLGRALMGMANLNDFLSTRKNAFAAAESMLKKLDAMPPGTGELNGTKLSAKFLTPQVRKLTDMTSMTNQPKYNVFDILRGKLKLSEATNADIERLPEYWTGTAKSISDRNMPRSDVLRQIETQGITGKGADAYRAYDARMNELENADLSGRTVKPITAAQNEDTGTGLNQSQRLAPQEFEKLAREGQKKLTRWRANGTGTAGLDDNWQALTDESWRRVQDEWGGATINAATGEMVADNADKYSVTVRDPGMKTISIPIGASEKTFRSAMAKARQQFGPVLDSRFGHLGVFRNETTGKIEFDPALVLDSKTEVEQVGAATHAQGGAYHFKSGLGYWVPHVANEFENETSLRLARQQLKAEGGALLEQHPDIAAAHDQALTEYQGSNALAKLRSFRSNLSDPHNSLAVTMDSVMAKLYGFSGQDWAGGGTYGSKAAEVREAAQALSQRFGREVKPHEVQALLWVYTKMEVGRQDYGRLLYDHDLGQGELDSIEHQLSVGEPVDPKSFDPLAGYWDDELGQSREALDQRQRRTYLQKEAKRGPLPKDLQAELDALKPLDLRTGVRESQVVTTPPREDVGAIPTANDAYQWETRRSIPHDAKDLEFQEKRYATYVALRNEMQQAIGEGEVDKARKLFTSYVVKQRRSIMGDVGGSFAKVGEETRAEPKESAYLAEQRLNKGGVNPAPNAYAKRGNMDELHQQFMGHLRGVTMLDPGTDGRLMMRLFQDAAPDTLAHEGGHLLRQLLPPQEMEGVLARYPHITDETLTPAREAAEEKFVADMMFYVRQHARLGDAGPLSDVFRRIAATMEEQHAAVLDTTFGRSITPDVQSFWTRMFHPGIERPDALVDPINMRRMSTLAGTETKQFNWETDAQFAQRARQYGEARARIETAQFKANLMARAAAKADASARRMWAALTNEPTAVEAKAQKLETHAHNILTQLGQQLDDPARGQVPRAWQPMWEAFQALNEQVKLQPQLAEYMDEIPATFSQVLRYAAEHGFEPQYIQDLTWERAQRLMFGHIQLGKGGTTEITSGQRKENRGVISRAGLADRSFEALAAGSVEATHELYSNKLIGFVDTNWARAHTPGTEVPQGWKAWDPAREFILTGTDKRGQFVAANATKIIPAAVDRALTSMSGRFDHWSFHTLSKVTKPWITYNLTMSPKWYLHIAISNVVRTLAEGVGLRDWKTAINQWKTGTLPEEVYGNGVASLIADNNSSLIGLSVKDAMKREGVKQALTEVRGRVSKVHDVMDELSRAAVFEKTLRETGSRAQALTRTYDGLVDYGNMTPFERGAIRSLIPFYPFYKGMVKLLAHFPADHPVATSVLLQAGKMHEEYLQDKLGGAVPDAYRGYANIFGFKNFTLLDPFLNPVHLVDIHEVNSTLNPFVDIMLRTAYNAAEPGTGQPGMTATGQKVTQVNPAAALGAQLASPQLSRFAAQVATGSDVYHKQQGVAGAIGQLLGVPQNVDVQKIQNTVMKTLGTLPKKGEPGYVAPKRTKVKSTHFSSRHIRRSFLRLRHIPRPHAKRAKIVR